jgi:rfaE bifunctional protein nucleotidyltransferase chain/domain
MHTQSQSRVFADAREARKWIAPLRDAGKTLVTTNGCFDIIHAGHIQYLQEAAAQGDVLAVGLNADETVRKLKGPDRPLNREDDRALVAASLRMVSCAFVFREDDPRAFIDILKPDVHVKGGDYSADIIERPNVERWGGTVAIVSFRDGYSTTRIVERIRS